MGKGYALEGDVIVIHRDLTELDRFVKDFLSVFTKHAEYLIVSGFVSISSGRTRATEDVDLLMPALEFSTFTNLFLDLQKHGFWCYQGDTSAEAFDYVKDMTSIRFARKNTLFPNMECIPINQSKRAKWFEFSHPQKIRIKNFEFNAPPIEFEILYKEIILTGKKDLEDARHLRTFFADLLKPERFKMFKNIIEQELT